MGLFVSLGTFHGSTVAADPKGILLHASESEDSAGLLRVFGYAKSAQAACWYLLADSEDLQPLTLIPQPAFGSVVPVRATNINQSGHIHFYAPNGGAFLCAAPLENAAKSAPLALAASLPREFEQFEIIPVHQSKLSSHLKFVASMIDECGGAEPNPDAFAAFILSGAGNGGLAASVLNAAGAFLSPLDWKHVIGRLLQRPDATVAGLRAIFGNDIWTDDAIPGILRKLRPNQARPNNLVDSDFGATATDMRSSTGITNVVSATPEIRIIGQDYDRLDSEGFQGEYVSAPFALNIHLRRQVEPSKRSCIVATARNEGVYLLEWIAYHKAVGFDHIFLYSNDNEDGSDALLEALAAAGEVTWIKNVVGPGRRAQWKAYGHALRIMPDTLDFEWSLLIDLDEFFVPGPMFASIGDFLNWHSSRVVDAIGVNWLMVSSNGESHWRDEPMATRFPKAISGANPHIKSLFRTHKFTHSYAHDPGTLKDEPIVFRNASGDVHRYDPLLSRGIATNPDMTMAAIIHFFFKSNEEFVWKSSRNRGDHACANEMNFAGWDEAILRAHVASSASGQTETGLSRFSHRMLAQINRLLADPKAREANDRVKTIYKERIGQLVQMAVTHPAILQAGDAGQAFIAPLVGKSCGR
jgi:hypothetical protein